MALKFTALNVGGGESGMPIEVAELPTPTADTVGKVYKVGEDYYVGEESFVLWADREDVGDKIYLNTSVDIPEIMKDEPMVEGQTQVEVFNLSNGSSWRSITCNKLDLSLLGMQGYMYAIIDYNDTLLYISADGLTVEQLNELLVSMGAPYSFTHFGWQIDEYVPEIYAGLTQVSLNEYPNGQPFAYKSKTFTFKNLDNPPILQEKTVTENGEVVADSGFDGLSKVTIDVQPTLEQTTITENGTFTPSGGYDGFSSVKVDVPTPVFKTQEKTVTENGVVTPDDGYDGLSKVTVEVASTGGGEAQATLNALIDRSITEIESDMVKVGASAFRQCYRLKRISFPKATSIEAFAFVDCTTLQTVYCPNVTSINRESFSFCEKMTEIALPNLTACKSTNSFSYCGSLTKLIVGTNKTTVATLANTNAFTTCYHILGTTHSTYNPTGAKDGYIYVPLSLVADYRSATNWATYATQIMPYVATVGELANIDGTTYDKACVGADYIEYTYNGTNWEVYR